MLPVDFPYPETLIYNLVLQLPEGYVADQVPETRGIQSALPSSAMVTSSVTGNVVRFTFRFTLDALICTPESYRAVRNYWQELCGIYNQMIVIRKSDG